MVPRAPALREGPHREGWGSPPERLACGPGAVAQWIEATRSSGASRGTDTGVTDHSLGGSDPASRVLCQPGTGRPWPGSRTKGGAETLRAGTRIWKADCGAGGRALSPHREGPSAPAVTASGQVCGGSCTPDQWPRWGPGHRGKAPAARAAWKWGRDQQGAEGNLGQPRAQTSPEAAQGPASPHRGLGTWGDAGRLQGGGAQQGLGCLFTPRGPGRAGEQMVSPTLSRS